MADNTPAPRLPAAQRGGLPTARATPGWPAALCGLVLLLASLLLFAPAALAAKGVRAAILVNLDTGRVLFEKRADTPVPPASLTKIMSMFLTLDAVSAKRLKLTEKVRIPAAAVAVGGSSMHLRAGERVTVRELLAGAAVASGNDAITALALRVGGSQRRFVQTMNRKARALGLRNTEFKNPSGLPAAGQHSTPRDMAALARAYLKVHPKALPFHNTHAISHRHRFLPNTNTLLGVTPGVNGLKTGWTVASGYNIIVTAARGKTRLLAVVMGGSSRRARDATAAALLEAGFRHGNNSKQIYAAMGHRYSPPRQSLGAQPASPQARPKPKATARPQAQGAPSPAPQRKAAPPSQRKAKPVQSEKRR